MFLLPYNKRQVTKNVLFPFQRVEQDVFYFSGRDKKLTFEESYDVFIRHISKAGRERRGRLERGHRHVIPVSKQCLVAAPGKFRSSSGIRGARLAGQALLCRFGLVAGFRKAFVLKSKASFARTGHRCLSWISF